MAIYVATGKPGTGKSCWTARVALSLLTRNKRYFDKTGVVRLVCSNLKFGEQVENYFGIYPNGLIKYWESPEQLVKVLDADVVWDEIATHLDNTQWASLPLEVKRFLQQHRKRGIDIYGNTQDFAMVDISFRRLTAELYVLYKLVGSRSPSATRPPIKKVWGIHIIRTIDIDSFEKENKHISGWRFFWINRRLVDTFDTRQEIKVGTYPPYKHIVRRCIDPKCDYERIIHQ
jgi:hypothetical protein